MRCCPGAVVCMLNTIAYRAPTLFRRFGSAGEVAVDLLARLLSFDPVRRCSSEVRSCTPPAGNDRLMCLGQRMQLGWVARRSLLAWPQQARRGCCMCPRISASTGALR